MTRPDKRWRGTREEARRLASAPSKCPAHVVANPDGTFSVVHHMASFRCDYCRAESELGEVEHRFKANIFEESDGNGVRRDRWPALLPFRI